MHIETDGLSVCKIGQRVNVGRQSKRHWDRILLNFEIVILIARINFMISIRHNLALENGEHTKF